MQKRRRRTANQDWEAILKTLSLENRNTIGGLREFLLKEELNPLHVDRVYKTLIGFTEKLNSDLEVFVRTRGTQFGNTGVFDWTTDQVFIDYTKANPTHSVHLQPGLKHLCIQLGINMKAWGNRHGPLHKVRMNNSPTDEEQAT